MQQDAEAAAAQQAELLEQAAQQAEREAQIQAEKDAADRESRAQRAAAIRAQEAKAAAEAALRQEAHEAACAQQLAQLDADVQKQMLDAMQSAAQRVMASATLSELQAHIQQARRQKVQLDAEIADAKTALARKQAPIRVASHTTVWSDAHIHQLLVACTQMAATHAASSADVLPSIHALDQDFEEVKKRMEQPLAERDHLTLLSTAEQHLLRSEAVGERADTTALCALRNRGMWLATLKKHVWPSILQAHRLRNKSRANKTEAPAPTQFRAWVQEHMHVKRSKDKQGWNGQYIFSLEKLADVCVAFSAFVYLNNVEPELTLTRLYANIQSVQRIIAEAHTVGV